MKCSHSGARFAWESTTIAETERVKTGTSRTDHSTLCNIDMIGCGSEPMSARCVLTWRSRKTARAKYHGTAIMKLAKKW